jgi:hypothetical protein
MKALRLLFCFALAQGGFAADPPRPAAAPARQYAESDVPAFRIFFKQPGALTAQQVEDRFGPPPKYSPLLLNETAADARREHSWWYYPVGKERSVGVMIDAGKVRGAFYFFRRDKGEGQDAEVFRQNEIF